jgi:hypothetical protein
MTKWMNIKGVMEEPKREQQSNCVMAKGTRTDEDKRS